MILWSQSQFGCHNDRSLRTVSPLTHPVPSFCHTPYYSQAYILALCTPTLAGMRKNKLHDREEEKAPTGHQQSHDSGLEGNTRTSRTTGVPRSKGIMTGDSPGPYNPYKKPDLPYRQLVTQALSASPSRSLSLRDIYDWIETTYPYYFYDSNKSWKNAVRHNLSIQNAFRKIPKVSEGEEKSCLWELTGETGTKRKSPSRRRSEPIVVLAPPMHHPQIFRAIRAMPVPPVDKPEKQKLGRKRRSSEPAVHHEPVPILPKPLLYEDQPIRITSPMLASSQSLDDNWLTPDFYTAPFPYSRLDMDEYLYRQPFWMSKLDQNPPPQEPDVYPQQQEPSQLLADISLDMMDRGDDLFARL